MNPPDWCTRSLLRLQFAADGITDDWILRSTAVYWPIRRAARAERRCGAMASPGVRDRSSDPPGSQLRRAEPDAERQSAASCSTTIARRTAVHGACAGPHSYTCTGVFPRLPLGMTRSQRSSPLSRCGMNLLRMSSDLGGARLPAALPVPRARFAVGRPDPSMEQLHVAMSVVGGQAAREIATPALPQRRRVAQGVPHPDRAAARPRCARPAGVAVRCAPTLGRRAGRARPPRSAAAKRHPGPAGVRRSRQCRGLPLRRVPRHSTGRDMNPPWCRWVRIGSAVRALHRA
jgi:hypothetical protein